MPEKDKKNSEQVNQKKSQNEEKSSDLSLSTLPQEVIENIFSYLSASNIVKISRTGKFFKGVSDKDAVWREQTRKDFCDLLEFFEKAEDQTWLEYYKEIKPLTEKYGSTKLLIEKLRKAKEDEDNLTATLSETFKLRMTGGVLAYNEMRQLFSQHLEFYIQLFQSGHKKFGLKLAKLLLADRLYGTYLATREHHRTLKEILESLIERKFHVEDCEFYLYDYFANMTDTGPGLEEEESENEENDINKYYSPKNKLFFRDAFTKAVMKEADFISYVFAHGERAVNLVAMHLLNFINIGHEVDTAKILLDEIEEKRKNNFQMSKEEERSKIFFSFHQKTRIILNFFDDPDALRQKAASILGLDKPPQLEKLLGLRPDSPGPGQAVPLEELFAMAPGLAELFESDNTSSGSEEFASDDEDFDADSPKP